MPYNDSTQKIERIGKFVDLYAAREVAMRSQFDAHLDDLVDAMNAVRPVSAGGTGGGSPAEALKSLGIRYVLPTVQAIAADTTLSYAAAAGKYDVAVGDRIQAGRYLYQVVASGASAYDFVTSGGVKLITVNNQDGGTTAAQLGASPSASASVNAAAIAAAVAKGAPVDFDPVALPANNLNTIDATVLRSVPATASLTSVMAGDIFARDRGGRVIGLKYNHRHEKTWTAAYPRNVAGAPIISGNLMPPPISNAAPVGGVDVVAHWYGYWGADWLRQATGIADEGFDHYYDWHLQWDTAPGYDPDRHPVIGWYRQDDPHVLDWQCYWLREAGLRSVIPCAFDLNVATWHLPSDRHHWLYQLFNNTPNFRGLTYIPWVQSSAWANAPSTPTEAEIIAQWDSIIFTLCDAHRNNYVMSHRGKRWMALYCWDTNFLLSTVFGGNVANFRTFLSNRAAAARTRGYDGIALMVHSPTSDAVLDYDLLLSLGVAYFYAPYSGNWGSPSATTYPEVVQQLVLPTSNFIPTATASLLSIDPVPDLEKFNWPGHSPEWFQIYLQKCIQHVRQLPNIPDMITVGHLSEWTESGPGLTPSIGAGWGYLDAIRAAAMREGTYGSTLWPPEELTLANGWVNFGGVTEPLTVTRSADRMIVISGVIKSGTTTSGTRITTLPTWARPAANLVFPVALDGGFIGSVLITAATGDITVLGPVNATLTSLCGIAFRSA